MSLIQTLIERLPSGTVVRELIVYSVSCRHSTFSVISSSTEDTEKVWKRSLGRKVRTVDGIEKLVTKSFGSIKKSIYYMYYTCKFIHVNMYMYM